VQRKLVGVVVVLGIVLTALFLLAPGPPQNEGFDGEELFDPSLPSGVLEFTSSPLPEDSIQYIIPLGNLGPPGHTTPTDHIYFVYGPTAVEVIAPAAGKVLRIENFEGSGDQGITIGVTNSYSYYFFHIILDDDIGVGDWVKAGQRLGTTAPPSAFDLGVLNKSLVNPFANPDRYPEDKIHADAPLKYFKEPIRSALYAKVARTGDDKDGKICYDEPGKLIGNWWSSEAPSDLLSAQNYESYAIAFVYSNFEPDRIMISIGCNFSGEDGLTSGAYYAIGPRPENVTTASGKVTYILYEYIQGQNPVVGERVGLLVVEMLNEGTIKVQAFADTISDTREFTSDAKSYLR